MGLMVVVIMNEVANKVDRFINESLGALSIKEQQFVASVVLGENVEDAVREIYLVDNDREAKIKARFLLSMPEIKKVVEQLKKSNAVLIQSKLNNMIPEALDKLGNIMKNSYDEELQYKASKDIAKMGIDLMKQNEENSQPQIKVSVDNINILQGEVSSEKIANSFTPKNVVDVDVVEDEEDE
jgi:hypothetical protein